jgi:hypothetical protein
MNEFVTRRGIERIVICPFISEIRVRLRILRQSFVNHIVGRESLEGFLSFVSQHYSTSILNIPFVSSNFSLILHLSWIQSYLSLFNIHCRTLFYAQNTISSKSSYTSLSNVRPSKNGTSLASELSDGPNVTRGLGKNHGSVASAPRTAAGLAIEFTLFLRTDCHLFLTALSVRPGRRAAILDHLLPHCSWHRITVESSAAVQALGRLSLEW